MNPVLGGSTVCPAPQFSPSVVVIVQTLADVPLKKKKYSEVLEKVEFCASLNCVYTWPSARVLQGDKVEVRNPKHWNMI